MKWFYIYDLVIAKSMLHNNFIAKNAFKEAQQILSDKYIENVTIKAISSRYYRKKEYINKIISDVIAQESVYKEQKKEQKKNWFQRIWYKIFK